MKPGLICLLALIPLGLRESPMLRRQTVQTDKTDGIPCLFDAERGEVPRCVRKDDKGSLVIAPEIRKELHFDTYGLAVVRTSSEGWMYVNRQGRVLITGVPIFDNWADSFHDGLVRFVSGGKYGFANRSGKVVIAPIYDGALNFEKRRAQVCKGCKSTCAGAECENHLFTGGDWFEIDPEGTVLDRLPSQP